MIGEMDAKEGYWVRWINGIDPCLELRSTVSFDPVSMTFVGCRTHAPPRRKAVISEEASAETQGFQILVQRLYLSIHTEWERKGVNSLLAPWMARPEGAHELSRRTIAMAVIIGEIELDNVRQVMLKSWRFSPAIHLRPIWSNWWWSRSRLRL